MINPSIDTNTFSSTEVVEILHLNLSLETAQFMNVTNE